jgi:hypothetical protein
MPILRVEVLPHKTSLTPPLFSVCTKSGKWTVMNLCVKGIDLAFYDFDIWFWNGSFSFSFHYLHYSYVISRKIPVFYFLELHVKLCENIPGIK